MKYALRQWYKKFNSFIVSHGYIRIDINHCVYFKTFLEGKFVITLFYEDDMLIVEKDVTVTSGLIKELIGSFNMKDLGLAQ